MQSVNRAEKLPRLQQLLEQRLPDDGSAVVYCATRKGAQESSDYLSTQDLPAACFHTGLESGLKREVQESFIDGRVRIIYATNAFGWASTRTTCAW